MTINMIVVYHTVVSRQEGREVYNLSATPKWTITLDAHSERLVGIFEQVKD